MGSMSGMRWRFFLFSAALSGGAMAEDPAQEILSMANSTGASCGIDAIAAADKLAQATSSINVAMAECSQPQADPTTSCGVPVAQVVEAFLYVASFVSGAADQCSKAFNLEQMFNNLGIHFFKEDKAACSEVVTGFMAGLAEVIDVSLELKQSCKSLTSAGVSDQSSQLIPVSEMEDAQAKCSIDAAQVGLMLGRAGEEIVRASSACKAPLIINPANMEEQKATCGMDVASVFASFSLVAQSLAMAVDSCSLNFHMLESCAASVSGLIGGLSEISAMGAGFKAQCSRVPQSAINIQPFTI